MRLYSVGSFYSRSFLTLLAFAALQLITPAAGQAQSSTTTYVFSHLAGPLGGWGNADGTGSTARFLFPTGAAVDHAGNVFVSDNFTQTIRKIAPGGVVTTFAQLSSLPDGMDGFFLVPSGIAVDGTGNIYVAASYAQTILQITPGGIVTTLAGSTEVAGSTDATGSAAQFNAPAGIAVDGSGNVYVADSGNHTIRKIAPGGIVTTLAGTAGTPGSADGTGSAAQFNSPYAVTVDSNGNVFVADTNNSTIRKIAPGGVVTTLAGTVGMQGQTDGAGSAARFFSPAGITVDGAGNVFVADAYTNVLRKITPTGVVTTLAGSPNVAGSGDGTGAAALFSSPAGLAADAAGNVFVADSENYAIRKCTPSGVVTTLAGLAGGYGNTDGAGTTASFDGPSSVTVDGTGNLFVADYYNSAIRKVTPSGVVTTFAGTAGVTGAADGTGPAAQFNSPFGVASDGAGNLFVADTGNEVIRKITAAGVVTTFAGTAGVTGAADGTGPTAQFNSPFSLAVDRNGNVFVADAYNNTIRKITAEGMVTTFAGTAGVAGSADGTGTGAQFNSPYGVAVDSGGNVYVADTQNYTIRKITTGGIVTTLAGLAGSYGDADGTGTGARFSTSTGLVVDSAGNIFVADYGNSSVRKITPAGVVTTVAGSANILGSADGIGSSAQFNLLTGLAIDNTGNLYVTDFNNNAIRKGQLAGPPVITAQPQNQTAASGGNVQFSVIASGVLPATYQWNHGGSAIAGATSSSLSLSAVSSANAGDYSVTVTNQLGSVTSNNATLTISAASSSSGGGGGGGSMEPWLALALLGLGLARRGQKRKPYFSRT